MNRWSRTITILFFALALFQGSDAQPSDISRLRHIMLEKQAKAFYTRDTSYIDVLDSLAYGYYRISADSLFLYSKKALAYAKEAGYAKGESVSLRVMGNGYGLNGDYTNMFSCYQQALAIAEKIKSPLLIAKATINMAIMYYSRIGQINEALVLMEKAGNIFESVGDTLDLIKSLQSRGNLWVDQKQYEKALQVFHRAAELATSMKNEYLLVTTNDVIGGILDAKGLNKEALPYSLATLRYFNRTDDKMRISRSANFMGDT